MKPSVNPPSPHCLSASRRGFLRSGVRTGLAGLLASQLGFTSNLWASEPHPIRSPLNNLTDQDEIALGNIFAAKIEKELPLVQNAVIDAYLNGIVDKLAAASQRPKLPYNCKLVNIAELNAFSIAGGNIYLNRGLVDALSHEDELVATISHEIGHVVGRHSANQIMLTFRARQAYDLVKNNIPQHSQLIDQVIERLGGAVAVLAMLHFSRANEMEADMLGFYEMLRAGYEPTGFLTLFQTFIDLEKNSPGLPPAFLRDHPPATERAAAIRSELSQVSISKDAVSDSFSFHAFRLAMNLLPAPHKSGEK